MRGFGKICALCDAIAFNQTGLALLMLHIECYKFYLARPGSSLAGRKVGPAETGTLKKQLEPEKSKTETETSEAESESESPERRGVARRQRSDSEGKKKL